MLKMWSASVLLFVLSALPVNTQAQAPVSADSSASTSSGTTQLTVSEVSRMVDRGREAEALKTLDALEAHPPVPAGVDRLRGRAFYAEGNFKAAESAFALAVAKDPKDRESAQLRGVTLFRLGRVDEAIPLLERTREMTEQSKADPNYVLGLCYMETRRYDDARRAFASQYGFTPDSAAAYLLAGRMFFRREYLPVAKEAVEKAISIDPKLPRAHLLLGEIDLAGQKVSDAVTEFEEERKWNPLEPSIYDRLGDAYLRDAQYAQSVHALQQAILLEPDATGPYILLGKALLKQNDAVSAAAYLERAKQMDPNNYTTRGLLGQAYRQMGRTDDAVRELREAENLQAESAPKLTMSH